LAGSLRRDGFVVTCGHASQRRPSSHLAQLLRAACRDLDQFHVRVGGVVELLPMTVGRPSDRRNNIFGKRDLTTK
jgi:hypothetical protein